MKETVRFDLHVHTRQSDGKDSAERMIVAAREHGLQYLGITNHNIATPIDEGRAYGEQKVGVIGGFEISSRLGHVVVLGIPHETANKQLKKWGLNPRNLYGGNRGLKMRDMLWWSVDQGGCNIFAHPGLPISTLSPLAGIDELFKRELIHGAEVHNFQIELGMRMVGLGFLYEYRHKRIARFMEDRGIPTLADSDAHRAEDVGRRYNLATVEYGIDVDKFLGDLRERRLQISHEEMKDPKR